MTNWKTTLSAIAAALTGFLTVVAALPYELGDIANIFPPDWKLRIAIAGAIATLILRTINGTWQKDKDVTGGVRATQPENPVPTTETRP